MAGFCPTLLSIYKDCFPMNPPIFWGAISVPGFTRGFRLALRSSSYLCLLQSQSTILGWADVGCTQWMWGVFFLCGKSLENEYIFLLVGELAEFCGIYFCCGWSFQPWWSHGFFLSVFSAVKLAADLLNQTKATWWEKTSQWIFELFFRAFSWLFWERVTFWTFWRMTGILKMILEYAYFGHSC